MSCVAVLLDMCVGRTGHTLTFKSAYTHGVHACISSQDTMEFNTHDEVKWHAATDRYADALRRLSSGDRSARTAVMAAYRQLQIIAPLNAAEAELRTRPPTFRP